jgi:SnoaL-like domain
MVTLEGRIPVRGAPASPMKTQTTALDNSSVDATTPDQILHAFLASWRRGNVVEAAHQFSDQFTFTDHALGLEFKDKEHLTEFLAKAREFFSDTQRTDHTICNNEDGVITERSTSMSLRHTPRTVMSCPLGVAKDCHRGTSRNGERVGSP